MKKRMSEENKTIIVVSLCIAFIVNSIMFGWEATRRSADELQKIEIINLMPQAEIIRKGKECVKAGGLPDYYDDGSWQRCEQKN